MPAFHENTSRRTYVAGSDLSAGQFRFVKLAADGEIDLAGNADAAEGILFNDPVAGEPATVVYDGRVQVWVGTGGLTAADNVGIDANGAAVTAATGDIIVAKALFDAVAGELTTVEIVRGGNASA